MPTKHWSDKRQRVMLQSPGFNVATMGLLSMVAVHFLVLFTWNVDGEEAAYRIYQEGGLTWAGVCSGKVWQFFTHSWLHGGWGHLVANAFLFYYAAARLSHVLSNRRIAVVFLLTSLAAGVAQVLSQAMFPGLQGGIFVGSSAGIMGMLLGFFALSPDSKMLFLPVSARNVAKGFLISSAFFTLINPALGIPLMSDVGLWLSGLLGNEVFRWGHLAHFVGGILGWTCIGRFFPRLLTSQDLARMRMDNEVAAEVR
jgi:membrane associated rhomboid family serine protease